MQEYVRDLHRSGKIIGLVPTMGFLHDGHLSLVDIMRSRCDVLVMSIYVNPTQFGENEDLSRYPRDLKRDCSLAYDHGVDTIFHPDSGDLYPENYKTYVTVEDLSSKLCGASRPGHFRGVTTIVSKLFNIIRPDRAIFGQKDAQQALILQRMVRDLHFPVEILVGPITREDDGLAMSSRNTYLSGSERTQATALHRGLTRAKKMVESGETDSNIIIEEIRSVLQEQPDLRVDYAAVVNLENLEPLSRIEGPVLIAIAAFVGTTRLIDNIIIHADETNIIKIQDS